MRYVAPGDEDQKAPNLNRKQHGKQQAVRAVADPRDLDPHVANG